MARFLSVLTNFQMLVGCSMSSVIENYKTAYEEQHHAVEKIRVGLPVRKSLLIWLVLDWISVSFGFVGQVSID